MLKSLHIEDFALIERLDLEFGSGLNVLTGETGAGKSIILDALDAALGGAVSTQSVRSGSNRALIEATFAITQPLLQWLETQSIEPLEEGLVCSREITSRTSRSRINGILINRQQAQTLREKLVEITAQGQTLHLQNPSTQRRWLDGFGGSPLHKARQTVQAHYQSWNQIKTELESYQQDIQTRLQRLDLLKFQAQELNSLNLTDPHELEQLERERDRLDHSVDLQTQSLELYQLLYQADGETLTVADLLGQAETLIQAMTNLDPDLESIAEMITSARVQTEEASRFLYDYGEGLETDPGRLEKIDKRVTRLKQMSRKYGPTLAEMIQHAQQVNAELDQIQDQGSSLEDLQKAEIAHREKLVHACEGLTQLRHKAATRLEKNLVAELSPLGMSGVQFKVEIKPGSLSAEGHDQITYLFSTNLGEPLQPLAKVASGGEMSRFLLALKVVFSQVDPVATMVFDEIDAGVSGKMAQAIATKLHAIARHHQILCVTHQPLIAALADHHIRVSKAVQRKRTQVLADPLSADQRREELAQLAAGHSAQDALAFVEALLAQAAQMRSEDPAPPISTSISTPVSTPISS